MKICVCGAKKFFPEMDKLRQFLSGSKNEIIFPEMNHDENMDIAARRSIADRHNERISQSDAIYIFNPGGHIGKGTNLEVGVAVALGKHIFATDFVGDNGVDCFIERLFPVDNIGNIDIN